MIVAAFVDSTDGPLARAVNVKRRVPEVDGALLDNIVDYLTWTFVPVILLWQSDWLTEPAWLWCSMALLGSAFAFGRLLSEGFAKLSTRGEGTSASTSSSVAVVPKYSRSTSLLCSAVIGKACCEED